MNSSNSLRDRRRNLHDQHADAKLHVIDHVQPKEAADEVVCRLKLSLLWLLIGRERDMQTCQAVRDIERGKIGIEIEMETEMEIVRRWLKASPSAVVGVLLVGVLLYWMWRRSRRFTHIPSLHGKHVVITGGSSGIGLSMAMQCAEEGAYVTIMSRSLRKLEEARRHITSSLNLPQEAIRLQAVDVGDAGPTATAINESFAWRPIDVLVCSAGITELNFLEDMKPNRLEEIARTNILGVVFPIQSAIPLMRTRSQDHPSSIVIIGSLCSCAVLYGSNIYNASKAGVKGLAELLKLEMLPFGIGVTLSMPGFTLTPMLQEAEANEDTAGLTEILRKILAGAPMETPDDVARLTIKGFKRNEFLVSTTFSGFVASVMGRGFIPSDSLITFAAELLLMIPIRIFTLLWLIRAKHILLSTPVPTKKTT